jgi:hypothetical protein
MSNFPFAFLLPVSLLKLINHNWVYEGWLYKKTMYVLASFLFFCLFSVFFFFFFESHPFTTPTQTVQLEQSYSDLPLLPLPLGVHDGQNLTDFVGAPAALDEEDGLELVGLLPFLLEPLVPGVLTLFQDLLVLLIDVSEPLLQV